MSYTQVYRSHALRCAAHRKGWAERCSHARQAQSRATVENRDLRYAPPAHTGCESLPQKPGVDPPTQAAKSAKWKYHATPSIGSGGAQQNAAVGAASVPHHDGNGRCRGAIQHPNLNSFCLECLREVDDEFLSPLRQGRRGARRKQNDSFHGFLAATMNCSDRHAQFLSCPSRRAQQPRLPCSQSNVTSTKLPIPSCRVMRNPASSIILRAARKLTR